MSGVSDRIADEAQRFLATELSDYELSLRDTGSSYSFFYLHLSYQGRMIASDSFSKPFQYRKARRWIRHHVRNHRRLLATVTNEGVRYQEGRS